MIRITDDQNLDEEVVADVISIPKGSLPEKFGDDPMKLVDAYQNLEREYHKSREEAKAVQENYQELAAQFETFNERASQPQVDPGDYEARWNEDFETNPMRAVAKLANDLSDLKLKEYQGQVGQQMQPTQQATEELVAMQATDFLSRKHADWDDVAPKMRDFLAEKPYLLPPDVRTSPQKTVDALETVYSLVKATDLASADPAVQQAALSRYYKEQTQTMTGASGRPDAPQEDDWDRVKKASGPPGRYWS